MKHNEKHLEFIESNIARMNQCSFQMKGWAITIISALIAVYISTKTNNYTDGNKSLIYFAIFPAALFWFLDSLYLSKENKFIGIYNNLIGTETKKPITIKDFEIPIRKIKGFKYSILYALISPSESVFYLSIIIALIVLGKVL